MNIKSPATDVDLGVMSGHNNRSVTNPGRSVAGPTWVWIGEGKAHLVDCFMVRPQVEGIAEGRYESPDQLDSQDLLRWRSRVHFSDTYPGDIPICCFCERRGA